MITVKKLSKSFKENRVLNDISILLPRTGLVAICGDSGCGKTTLLNCLSSLIDFEGEIIIDGVCLSKLSEEEKDTFRLKKMGFVFQDFKLFNSETIERNVLLPLDMSNSMKKKLKMRKVNDLLELVGLDGRNNQKINQLSGGEKQRAAIARALVNDPKIILADEPTGALDSINAEEIMSILETISKKSLVVIVSHDEPLMKKYASQIVHMSDGRIVQNEYPNREERDAYLPVLKNKASNMKPSLPSSFLFRHSLMSMKEKKWRTIICSIVTSLGLIGVGLATSISTSISANVKKAYSSMIDESKIVMSINKKETYPTRIAGGYYEAMDIANHFPQYVMDVGVNYITDFENYFKSINEFAIASTTYRRVVEGFSARHINDFKWLDYYNPSIYPNKITDLKQDEIILGMNMPTIQNICLNLRIERTVKSLSEYLEQNELLLYLDVGNDDWMYRDQQLFSVKGFTLEPELCIYHTDHLWNEYVFENRMRLPTNDVLSQADYYPWVMKKIYYFHTFSNTDDFLIEAEESPLLDEFTLDIASTNVYPWLYRNIDVKNRHRVLFYNNSTKSIPKRYADILIEENKDIDSPIYGSNGGYIFYPSNMLSGFSHQTFFSFSELLLENVINENTSLSLERNEYTILKDGVMVGHYSKTMTESVRFAVINDKNVIGNKPKTLDEIVISSSLAKCLLAGNEIIGRTLFISYNDKEMLLEDGSLKRSFINQQMTVCGVVESERFEIYHYPYWTTNYFKSRLGVSAFDLGVTSIAFNNKDKNVDKTISNISKAFPYYDVVNPMSSVNQSVNQMCFYIEVALLVFSVVAILVASLLLTMCTYLHILDSQKEIALSRCLGISKRESKKFVIFHTVLLTLISLVLSIVEIIFVSFISSFAISKTLNSSMVFVFDVKGIIFMSIVALVVAFFSSFWSANKVSKLNPLEVLKK